jgi:cobaltochelatase CobS
MTTLEDFVAAVADANGHAFVNPMKVSAETLAALQSLAIFAGMPIENANVGTPQDLLSIYMVARSKSPQDASVIAARVSKAIDKRYGRSPSPVIPAPAAPSGAPTADPAIIEAMIAAAVKAAVAPLQAELTAIRERTPTELKVIRPEVPPITVATPHPVLSRVLKWLAARVNVYCHGPAGSGKTTMAEHAALALGVRFYTVSSVTDIIELTGHISQVNGQYHRTAFREAFEHGGLFLFDEMDSSDAAALVAFNMALANGYYSFPDGMVQKHPDFYCIAGANTVGNGATKKYVGRTQIDAATLNRFARVAVNYDEALELQLAANKDWALKVQKIRAICIDENIEAIVSPRATYFGSAGLAAGLTEQEALEDLLLADMSEMQRNVILARLR